MQSQFDRPMQNQVSFESLIKSQDKGAASPDYKLPQGQEDSFSRYVEAQEDARTSRSSNSRTSGTMPQWGADKTSHRSQYAPGAASAQSGEIGDYIGRNNTAHRSYSGGEIARKYVRDSDPRYADVGINDFVDIINPLQHIPVVSSIYRAVTGDEIKPPARIMGGGIYGGPIGLVSAMANTIVEDQTGGDIGENIMSSLSGGQGNKGLRTSFAGKQNSQDISGKPEFSSFDAAKKAYGAQSGGLDIAWSSEKPTQNYAPIDISDQVDVPDSFFDSKTSAEYSSFENYYEGQGQNIDDAAKYARSFGPGSYGASAVYEQAKDFGSSRTTGNMPEYSAKTLSLTPKTELAQQLRMDNPTPREPITRVQFD